MGIVNRNSINREAYLFMISSSEKYIYSSEWDGSDEVLLGQAHRIAREAKQYDRKSTKLNQFAFHILNKVANQRRDDEAILEILYENHECGGCEAREFADYGIDMY